MKDQMLIQIEHGQVIGISSTVPIFVSILDHDVLKCGDFGLEFNNLTEVESHVNIHSDIKNYVLEHKKRKGVNCGVIRK